MPNLGGITKPVSDLAAKAGKIKKISLKIKLASGKQVPNGNKQS